MLDFCGSCHRKSLIKQPNSLKHVLTNFWQRGLNCNQKISKVQKEIMTIWKLRNKFVERGNVTDKFNHEKQMKFFVFFKRKEESEVLYKSKH